MTGPQSTEYQLGEGFAFFRWHCLRWPYIHGCTGWNDRYAFCRYDWEDGDRG